ncbi:SNF5-like protein [Rhypophila decipiens]|uniref:SNF5-like protein n=1 Tax=Rhypophila decipiens TaxID=261697 RepID=A0AAN7BB08_9PEZI|nr:SNF5-like protein [Rhypophila decipiens]
MAASQAPSAPSVASSSISADGIAQTAAAASGTPAASSHPPSKRASPQPGATADIPHRDKDSLQKVLLERFMTRDWVHSAALKEDQIRLESETKRSLALVKEYKSVTEPGRPRPPPSVLYGQGYSGYGNGYTDVGGPAQIIYPTHKPRPGRRTTPALKFSRKDMKKQAEQHEELVPVRVDVDYDKVKLRDTFTYNLHERLIRTEVFAAQLVEDMGLKPPLDKPVHEQVVQQIQEQLCDFYPFVYSEEDALDPELPYSAYKNDEMRILVKLNITIGAHTLVDQFEWDINNPMNSPEEFAASMARDLSLSGEFTTAIAHCIREQVQLFTRSLYSIGYPFDGRPIEDPDLVSAFLPSPLPTVFRPQQQAKDFAPYLYENTEAELERSETMFSREQRRQKRSVNRRGGPQLPDLKERQRTIRTSIVSSVLPGAAQDIEETRLFKKTTAVGTISGRGGKRQMHGEISDSEDSSDSAPDSPAMAQLQGTARTRGMRGAATAATMRIVNIGRSETPEAIIHHHETRTSRRTFGRETTREETEEPTTYIVTLKVNPARLRKLVRDIKLKQSTPSGSATPSAAINRAPPAGSMGPPPHTPSGTNQKLPAKAATPSGPSNPVMDPWRAPAPPPGKDPLPPPPPVPDWLTRSLEELRKTFKDDSWEVIMKHMAFNKHTDTQVPMPQPGKEMPPDLVFYWIPRIKCLDCANQRMLYKPGPGLTTTNFQVHLNNRNHRQSVDIKLGRIPAAAEGTLAPAVAGTTPGTTPLPLTSSPAPGPGPGAGPALAAGATPTTNPP